MSNKGRVDKQQWQEDSSVFDEELRLGIDQVSAKQLQRWTSTDRFPLWIRIKWFVQRSGTR
jgi:hypothetical protein